MKNKSWWKIIFTAVLFNLSFEYSLRGLRDLFVHPVLLVLLFVIYFTYFTLVEDLIVRYRLKDYHLLFVSFIFGTIAQFLISGTALDSSGFAGVNWGRFLFVNLFWWGALQTILTFYLANRWFGTRNWNHGRIHIVGWLFGAVVIFGMVILFRLSGRIPPVSPAAFRAMVIVLFASFLALLIFNRKGSREPASFRRSRFLDGLGVVSVLFFLVYAVVNSNPSQVGASVIRMDALRFVTIWTLLLGLIMFGYRIFSRREIAI